MPSCETALALDESDSDVHRILAAIGVISRDLEKAMYHQERALSLNPNDDLIVVQQGENTTPGSDVPKRASRGYARR